jgi:hypothetical protein
MYLPKASEGGDFIPPPEGTFPAICFRIIDLGTQNTTFKGNDKEQRKVFISWELKGDDTIMDDGRPMVISQRYTWSTFDKATLRKHLEAWRGQKFVDSDLGPGGFDIRTLIAAPCLVSVVHNHGAEGRVYGNVGAVMKMPKGMTAGSLINETAFLWLTPEEFDAAVFEKLSDGLKATIRKSPEYQQLVGGKAASKPAANAYREQSQSAHSPPPDDDMERWGPPRESW